MTLPACRSLVGRERTRRHRCHGDRGADRRVQDRNGPRIADRLLELGVELAHITICGDRPRISRRRLRFLADQGVDLIVTSGGLGPTADDMTVATVARFAGLELVLDAALEDRITASSND
jgi:nicotinamide-nucleotide amidase